MGYLKPVKTDSVSKLVLERIKEALLNKELEPGDRLPSETELSNKLGVGKSSVREAIKMLEAMGIVEPRQGEGTFISERPKEDSLNPLVFQLIIEQGTNMDIVELRAMFEPAYSLQAMHKATVDDIQDIEQTIHSLEEKIIKNAQTADDDLAFHIAILKSTHNPFVIRIGETILQLFKASISKSMQTIPNTAVRDHKAIFEAFCKKDEEGLRKAIHNSFKGWLAMLEEDSQNKQKRSIS